MAGRRTLTELDQTTGPRDSAALVGAAPQAFNFWQAVPRAPHAEPAPQDFHRQPDHGEPTLGLPAWCRRTCCRGTLTGSAATGARPARGGMVGDHEARQPRKPAYQRTIVEELAKSKVSTLLRLACTCHCVERLNVGAQAWSCDTVGNGGADVGAPYRRVGKAVVWPRSRVR